MVEDGVVGVGQQLGVAKGFSAEPVAEIDEVEKQLNLDRLVDREFLGDAQVELVDPGLHEGVARA